MTRLRALCCSALLIWSCDGDDDSMSVADAGETDAAPVDVGVDAPEEEDAGPDAGPTTPDLENPALEAGNSSAPGDPRYQGMLRFLWDTWGAERLDGFPPPEFFLQLMEDEPEVFGDQLASFGFVTDPNDDFPVGFKRGIEDSTKMGQTCALCHVGRLPDGTVWLGLPNFELDWERFMVEVSQRWVAAGNEPLRTETEITKAEGVGPGRTGIESGDYPYSIPADFPAYFGLGDREYLSYLGSTRELRSEALLSIFAFGPGSPAGVAAGVELPDADRVAIFLEFFGSIEAPVGPPQDSDLVEAGAAVFERERCSACHNPGAPGTNPVSTYDYDGVERYPGDDPDFPNGSIATSHWHRVLIDGDGSGEGSPSDRRIEDLIQFIIANRLRVNMSDGYRIADLRGVWATAPYLHNGSVPTLEDLLKPAVERPTMFVRNGFDFDTSADGNGNEGHEFSTDLSAEDVEALVAFLKTL